MQELELALPEGMVILLEPKADSFGAKRGRVASASELPPGYQQVGGVVIDREVVTVAMPSERIVLGDPRRARLWLDGVTKAARKVLRHYRDATARRAVPGYEAESAIRGVEDRMAAAEVMRSRLGYRPVRIMK